LNERSPSDRFDDELEWDRDGQYYHYLTKWMHALNRAAQATGNDRYHLWALELARTAHGRFTYAYAPPSGGQKRMYWKMSIDLSRPLVPSMGQHDPLDGFVTYNQLQLYTQDAGKKSVYPDLSREIADMAVIMEGKGWITDDPLGIGGLLCDGYRTAQMIVKGCFERYDLLESVLDASLAGLESFVRTGSIQLPVDYRLAFRELGLSIGLHAVERLSGLVEKNSRFTESRTLHGRVEMLHRYTPLIDAIERFWLEPSNRAGKTWVEHGDINLVMLVTSLAPDGFLTI
jgi:hypothetical protein